MTQPALLSLVVAITGIYAFRWTRRLAPGTSELPVKTLIAVVLAALMVIAEFTALRAGPAFTWLALTVGPVYVLAPVVVLGLARGRRYRIAHALVRLLYWTGDGRDGLRRLLTQAALQHGDAAAAAALVPDDAPLLRVQLAALRTDWEEVLRLDVPGEGDNLALAEAARVEALIALERLDEAEGRVEGMRRRVEAEDAGPLAQRALQVSRARLAAARGRLPEAQAALQPPPPGVPPHRLLAILGRAATLAGHQAAPELWTRAYTAAPPAWKARYRPELEALGREIPATTRSTPVATLSLVAALVAFYLAQLALDAQAGPVMTALGRLQASSASAAFLLNIPGVDASDAPWRFLSYALVHGNLVHIALNAWVAWDVGRLYEARRGWGALLAAFVAGTAMGGYLTQVAQAGDTVILVGASGGVLGVAGALLADVVRGRGAGDRMLSRSLLQWMVLIALLSVAVPNVSLWGHVGGVVGGALWGFVRQGLPGDPRIPRVAGGLAVAAMVWSAFGAGSVALSLL